MKLNFVRPMILTAAVLTMGAAAHSQSKLIAKVPFSFRINGTALPSSSYTLDDRASSSRHVLRMVDIKTGKSVFAIATTAAANHAGSARLMFRCSDQTGCDLAEAWSDDGSGWKLPKANMKSAEYERLAVVPLRRSNAE